MYPAIMKKDSLKVQPVTGKMELEQIWKNQTAVLTQSLYQDLTYISQDIIIMARTI